MLRSIPNVQLNDRPISVDDVPSPEQASDRRNISNELTINDRLMQCAEQIKEIQQVNKKLRQTAKKLRINDDV